MSPAELEDLDARLFHPSVVLDQLLHQEEIDQVVHAFVLAPLEPLRAGMDLLRDLIAQRKTRDLDRAGETELAHVKRRHQLRLVRAALGRRSLDAERRPASTGVLQLHLEAMRTGFGDSRRLRVAEGE